MKGVTSFTWYLTFVEQKMLSSSMPGCSDRLLDKGRFALEETEADLRFFPLFHVNISFMVSFSRVAIWCAGYNENENIIVSN